MLNKILNDLPNFCINCHLPCSTIDLCRRCQEKLPWITHLPSQSTQYIDDIQSVFSHENPISQWIHQFKYSNRIQLSELFSQLMLKNLVLSLFVEEVYPVPIHSDRIKQRGYNQASILAKNIAKKLNLPFNNQSLSKKKNTGQQAKLTKSMRKNNIKNSFNYQNNKQVNGILIIDDVITTGETLKEIALEIKKKQPHCSIQAWTLTKSL